ncbi:hypothetical protein OO012_07375 [Rhodobacteraceae bacterium KMM 6894]|nr:hypothetical protein [Rhodobacteraceae bacterium KMM 6894]
MSVPQHIWLGLSSLIFVLWAFLMFRTLFRMSRAARAKAAERGASWPSMTEQFQEFGALFTAPRYRRDLLQLIGLSVALWAVQIIGHMLWPLGG